MADSSPDQLQILIDIRARLDEIAKVQAGLRGVAEDTKAAHESASELGSLFAHGLGIGSGMELARRAVDLFKSSFTEAVRISSQLASEIERAHGRLGLSGEAYQTLAAEARAAGTEFSEIMSSTAQYRAQLGEALLDPTKPTVIRQLALDAQSLANSPLERQMEQLAIALGKITDGNVRARLTQELFGRGAAAMAPLLERLRTEGYDKLRKTAEETNAVLGDGMAEALNRAGTSSEEANKRLGVALAPLNLKLIEAKTQLVNFLAKNAGTIQSGVEASFAGAFATAIANGLEKGVASVEKLGGWKKAFEKLGELAAGPFGVGFAVAVGGLIIKEIERRSLESDARQVAFSDKAARTPFDIQKEIPNLQSEDQLTELYNRAVTIYQKAVIERRKLMVAGRDEEQESQLQALESEIQHLGSVIPKIKERGRAAIEANNASRVSFQRLAEAQTDMFVVEMNHAKIQNSIQSTDAEKRTDDLIYLRNKKTLLDEIIALTKKLPLRTGEDPETRGREIKKLEGESAAVGQKLADAATPLKDREIIGRQYQKFTSGKNEGGGNALSAGEGVTAGAQQFVMSLGSQGQQVAGALQSTLGATVSSISEGIYGWATGAQSLGDTVRNLESSVMKTLLDTIVNMGFQWLVTAALAKGSMISTFLVGVGLRKAEAADVVGTEAVKTPVLATNAALASAGSFGLSAVIGIALLAALIGAFAAGGFADGGYTGDGSKYEYAGPAHKGEVVWSQSDIARAGGVDNVESLRLGGLDAIERLPVPAPARAQAAAAGGLSLSSAMAASAAAAPKKRERMIAVVDKPTMKQILRDDPDAEAVIADVMYRRRDRLV